MEFFNKTKVVKLRSHLDKYLIADDNGQAVRQSRHGSSRKARWLVEPVENSRHAIRLKSYLGGYLTASDVPFLLGMTGNKLLQTNPQNKKHDLSIEWQPIRDGFLVKLKSFGGTYLRANGGPPPWRNSVTHDSYPVSASTHGWILWDVEAVDDDDVMVESEFLSMNSASFSSSISSAYDLQSEIGSPEPVKSANSLHFSKVETGMDLFHNAKAVRLKSHHDKYLHAEEDEESITQDRNGSIKNAKWTVEFVGNGTNIIRLKSCYGKYLTASNQPFLLGMTGRKVLQTLPKRLDSSVEWEPVREGSQVKLKTRYGHFLRGNGGLPPWRNSVTHDIPHRTATQESILWDVHVIEILVHSPIPKPAPPPPPHSSFSSESPSPSTNSPLSASFSRQESNDSFTSPPKAAEGRMIYYHIADDNNDVDDSAEEYSITFKGNEVAELTRTLAEETGLNGIVVCSRSPLNGKLYPLRLQLPPNNVDMHVVVVQSHHEG